MVLLVGDYMSLCDIVINMVTSIQVKLAGRCTREAEGKAVKFGKFSSKNAANSEFLKNARIIR